MMPERLPSVLLAGLRHQASRHGDKLRFLTVGGIGFAVDGGMLLLLNGIAGWTPLLARMVGFPVAVSVTWLLNRTWTFRNARQHAAARQYTVYFVVQLGGLAINFSIFALLVTYSAWFAGHSLLALAAGAALALVFTYTCSIRFAFSEASQ